MIFAYGHTFAWYAEDGENARLVDLCWVKHLIGTECDQSRFGGRYEEGYYPEGM